MDKIKADIIIISNYDSAYCWSIYLDGKIYTRKDIESIKEDSPIKHLFNAYNGCDYTDIDDILYTLFDYKTLIECDNGYITVIENKGERE